MKKKLAILQLWPFCDARVGKGWAKDFLIRKREMDLVACDKRLQNLWFDNRKKVGTFVVDDKAVRQIEVVEACRRLCGVSYPDVFVEAVTHKVRRCHRDAIEKR